MFYRSEGAEIAHWLYPQYTTCADGSERTTTKASDERHNRIQNTIIRLIREKGYCTEKEVIQEVQMSGRIADTQLKRSLTDIMNCNNLVKKKCTKELKERFCISCNGYPFIIYQQDV